MASKVSASGVANPPAEASGLLLGHHDQQIVSVVEGLGHKDVALDAAAREAGLDLMRAERSEIHAFVEVLEPPLRLMIYGAAHDAAPLVTQAAALGWSPNVVDDRREFLNRERFPEAAAFLHLERPDEMAKVAPLDERTCVVVMTHNFLRDKGYVRSLLGSPVRLMAMLGPALRSQRLLAELRDEGARISEIDLERIHSPAGIDLGAEGPEEIAAAICAEIVAVKRGRNAAS